MADLAIIELPPARWQEARNLRLESLRAEPSAFASSYAVEMAFSADVWQTRLESARQRLGNLTLFAEIDRELVGMAGATWSPKPKLRHVASVYGVYVTPNHRSHGIGMSLMRALLDELRTVPQIEKVSLTVNSERRSAVGLYQRLGFEIVGTAARELKLGDRYYDLHYMERQLTADD